MADERVRLLLDRIETELQAIFTDERFQQFLLISLRLADYSPRDQILILSQCPHATDVRTYDEWKRLGRFVKYREQGISILVPKLVTVKKPYPAGQASDGLTAEYIVEEQLRFVTETVFDVSQTEGEELQKIQPQTTDCAVLYEALQGLLPYTLGYSMAHDTDGFRIDHDRQELVLRLGMSDAQNLLALIRALAEIEAQNGKSTSAQHKQLCAESTALLLADTLGVSPSFDISLPGVTAGWTPEEKIVVLTEIGIDVAELTARAETQIAEHCKTQAKAKEEPGKNLDERLHTAKEAAAARQRERGELIAIGKDAFQ